VGLQQSEASYPCFLNLGNSSLGATETGLTGGEIGQLLSLKAIPDVAPTATKRFRLHAALSERQKRDGCGNAVLSFIATAMDPVRYAGRKTLFDQHRELLNGMLAFYGLTFQEDGRFLRVRVSTTLAEAEGRANRLRHELERRNVHPDVSRFCEAEFLQSNCLHAVFEATKSIAEKIRSKTGATTDGFPREHWKHIPGRSTSSSHPLRRSDSALKRRSDSRRSRTRRL
jgi:hypothetical protein